MLLLASNTNNTRVRVGSVFLVWAKDSFTKNKEKNISRVNLIKCIIPKLKEVTTINRMKSETY
jgi:hypothetical protein